MPQAPEVLVPMIAPNGSVARVPQSSIDHASAMGAQRAALLQGPDGSLAWVPGGQIQNAMKAGAVPAGNLPKKNEGFFGAVGNELKGVLGGLANLPKMLTNPEGAAADMGAQIGLDDMDRQREGRSAPYRAVAAAGTALGINARGMEQAANAGDAAGVLGHAAVPAALTVAAPAIARGANAASEGLRNAFLDAKTSAVRATVPEAAPLPSQALNGAEKIYRASAPVSSDPQFRTNLYKAAGDLAEIGSKLDLSDASGGVLQPDMRVKAVVDGVNDHLKEMYQTERAPQIERNAEAKVVPGLTTDSANGLEYLSRNAGTEADRVLAERALSNKFISLGDADALARVVNRELSPLRGMTPQELAAAEGNSRRLASLQALDKQLSNAIGNELANRGEAGIKLYEQRYAALSQVRDQLQSRLNLSQLQRQHTLSSAFGIVRRPMAAGASMAATANVNIGRMLQEGLTQLAKSGIRANRAVGAGAPQVRGLLTSGATQLPSSLEPLSPAATPQPVLQRQAPFQSATIEIANRLRGTR